MEVFLSIQKWDIYAAGPEAEHDLLSLDILVCEYLFSLLHSSIVSYEWARIGPPLPSYEARCRESVSSILAMIPVSCIVLALVSWLRPVRELIVMPSERGEIFYNLDILFLHFSFWYTTGFPVWRIELIFEHIDARMRDVGILCMELTDIRESFPGLRVRESEDEVDIYG